VFGRKSALSFFSNCEGFEEPAKILQQNTQAIVTLANRLELDVSSTDANDLLEAHKEDSRMKTS
jgi:hypothetical protein